jgi:HEAT repeat protein
VAWSDAASELHDALDLLYDDLENAITKSNLGDPEATAYLVVFLEADPWCFRSGYMKGRVYESLRRAHLDRSLQERLRPVLLNAVDAGYRREFRSSCRLAKQLADPVLTGELRRRLVASPDPHVRRRALWMLAYLPEGLEGQEQAVLDMLIQSADDENWLRVSDWVRKLCRRFTNDEFAQQVRSMALSADEATARRGLRLLPSAIRQPLDAGERLALEARIIDAAYGRGPGVHIIESLAAIADTGRLRRRLGDLATNAESPVKRYARWGLNAAVRANGKDPPDL